VQQQGKWLVKWSPATIAPQLGQGDQLSLQTTWPTRAPILGAGGTPLTTQGQVVTIGVEGARIKNAASVQSALVAAGATAPEASSAITAAKAHPTYFEPVFTVSQARYNSLEPTIYPIPGTVFQAGTALSAITPDLSSGVVGTVGPITAQELSQLGAPYDAESDVGQTGLEQADERQLAGTPGATVAVVATSGASIARLATLPAHPARRSAPRSSRPCSSGRVGTVRREQERRAGRGERVTGAVLAAVSVNSGGFDQAIDGSFPPGSTFKVITSTALMNHGLTRPRRPAARLPPRSTARCSTTPRAMRR